MNFYFIFGCVYISLFVGFIMSMVGEIPIPSTNPITWWDIVKLSTLVIIPFLVGYFAGEDQGKTRNK